MGEPVAPLAAIAEGATLACRVHGRDLLVGQVEGRLFAVDGRCPHAQGSLANGSLQGFELICPRHGARFDVRDGRCTSGTTDERLRVHAVYVEGGKVWVA